MKKEEKTFWIIVIKWIVLIVFIGLSINFCLSYEKDASIPYKENKELLP